MGDRPEMTSEILVVAETIRRELVTLVGNEAPAVGEAVGQLLQQARTAPDAAARRRAEDGLYRLLAEREGTRLRMDELLPQVVEERTDPSYSGLLGVPEPVAVDRWVCVHGDYEFPVLDLDDRPPRDCPTHGVPLVFMRAEG